MFGSPTNTGLVMEAVLGFLPARTITSLLERMSVWSPRLARGRNMREVSKSIARELVDEKSKEFESGQGERLKDMFSLLGERF